MILPLRPVLCAVIGICSCFGQTLILGADFADLLAKVPGSANVLVTLNAEKIFASDVATRDGWKEHYEATYADAPLMLPPGAQQFVLAAELDLAFMKPKWQAAVMRLADDPSTTLIARTVRGKRDTVGGLEVVAMPHDALIVKFGPHLFGLMQPDNRQSVARWIREAESGTAHPLSPYLQTAANLPDQVGTEIIMALDLTDAISRDRIRKAIEKSKVLREKSVDLDAAADVLTSLRGVTLGARVTGRVYGKLKVDFGRNIGVLKDVAKPLLLEVMDEAGARIDEFASWNVQTEKQRITIDGELTRDGLRRLFSFLELDATGVDAAASDGPTQPSKPSDTEVAQKSLKYYQSVAEHLRDLSRERDATTYSSIALWFDKYAKRIDRLPTLDVDPDLVSYGAYAVGRLRDARDAIQGVGIRSGAGAAGVTSGSVEGYRLFSGDSNYAKLEVSSVEAERRSIRASERAAGSTDVRAVMRELQDESSRIRRQMTDRYKIEFSDIASK
jgi:hypothetical protein